MGVEYVRRKKNAQLAEPHLVASRCDTLNLLKNNEKKQLLKQ
jgi:hypothetical protein